MSERMIDQAAQEEAYRRQIEESAVRERLQAIFDEAEAGSEDPGVTAEQLPGFLREHNR